MPNIESIINKTGYWRVVVKPSEYKENVESLDECKNIMEYASVSFRGWNFPHIDRSKIQNMSNWIEMETDWKQYKEYWKLFQSGQFAFKGAMVEDYMVDYIEENSNLVFDRGSKELSKKYLSILSCLYKVTEIFEFASRLIEKNKFINSFEISISLVDTFDRMLFFWDKWRDLRQHYICKMDRIEFKKTYNSNDFSSNKLDYANSCAQYIFERFNWDKSPGSIFKEEQLKLVEKRL